MTDNIKFFKAALDEPKRIVITTHTRPDADALGSSLCLKHYLTKLGHNVSVITPTGYPSFLKWMSGEEDVIIYTDDQETSGKLVEEADFIVCNDFSSLKRIDALGSLVQEAQGDKVLIDHHLHPDEFAKYTLWDSNASSTCELIYRLISQFGDNQLLDSDMGECLYAGIMTDTGSFRFPSTSKEVHLILADLIGKGVDHSRVHRLIYDDNKASRLRLLGYALSQKLVVLPELNAAYITLSQAELDEFDYKQGDTEGMVNYALSITGIVFASIIMEKDGMVKMSFRSVGKFNVNDFARTHFNGGGHKNAAGGASKESFVVTVDKFKNLIPKYAQELSYDRNAD